MQKKTFSGGNLMRDGLIVVGEKGYRIASKQQEVGDSKRPSIMCFEAPDLNKSFECVSKHLIQIRYASSCLQLILVKKVLS